MVYHIKNNFHQRNYISLSKEKSFLSNETKQFVKQKKYVYQRK